MTETDRSQNNRRVLLKISGEMLCDDQGYGLNYGRVSSLAKLLKPVVASGVELAIVVGAGNICRGRAYVEAGFNQVSADHMGMVATVVNAVALADILGQYDIEAVVRSGLAVESIAARFHREEALQQLEQGRVLICSGGAGNPLITTDTAAAVRAIELNADVLLKATKVDGVYSADPMVDPSATLFAQLSYDEVIQKALEVMDLSAFCLCQSHKMPIRVFNMNTSGSLTKALVGEEIGTLIS